MTHDELLRHLEAVTPVATARGEHGMEAMTWHWRLGHASFKTVVAFSTLARGNVSGMVGCMAVADKGHRGSES